MSRLFLCEKPSQARDIARVLGASGKADGCIIGNDVTVTWCFGHLLELAPPERYVEEGVNLWDVSRLPVIPKEWKMEVKKDGEKQFNIIARLLKTATEVVVATDADREGEVIGREVLLLAGYRGKVSRLWLSALDDASVKKALANIWPGEKTLNLFYAGVARGRADWLPGMNLTMAYTDVYGTGGGKKGVVSIGRVQTPTLALVVARDREIENFKAKDYFEVTAAWKAKDGTLPTRWMPPAALVDADGHCLDKKIAQAVVAKVKGQSGRVTKAETKPAKESAPLPFSLSALQQEASRMFGVSVKDVLDAAQALYETHKATTYPRSDCQFLPESQFVDAGGVLKAVATVGPEVASLVEHCDKSFRSRAWNDKKITAHHAIIPTANPAVDVKKMNALERKIYDLVRRRYIAQFLGDHDYMATEIEVVCQEETFRATGRTPVKAGWKLAYAGLQEEGDKKPSRKKAGAEEEQDDDTPLPRVTANEQVQNLDAQLQAKQTKPPQRYTEGTLVKDMESIGKMVTDPKLKAILKETAGIGTEATRASIIQNLFQREYISQEGKKSLVSTDKGRALVKMLPLSLTDPATTARWEQALEAIAEGRARLEDFMRLQEQWVTELVGKVKLEAKSRPPRQGGNGNAGDPRYPCPQCRKPMRLVAGPKGAFWGCTGYPECNHTLPDDNGKPGVRDVSGKSSSAETHPAGGRRDPPPGQVGEKCPECQKGALVQRFSKEKGRHFIGCNSFPACRYFKWDSPPESSSGAVATG